MPPKFDPIVEARIQLVIDAINSNLMHSIRAAATQFDVPYQRLLACINGRPNKKSVGGLNKVLNEAQELALIKYLDLSIELDFPICYNMLHSAAETILTECDSTRILGKGWAAQFVKRYPRYRTRKTVPLAAVRKAAHKTEVIETYFEEF